MPMKREIMQPLLEPAIQQEALLNAMTPLEYNGDPTTNVAPRHLHDFCFDTANAALYWASTTLAAGWKKLSP